MKNKLRIIGLTLLIWLVGSSAVSANSDVLSLYVTAYNQGTASGTIQGHGQFGQVTVSSHGNGTAYLVVHQTCPAEGPLAGTHGIAFEKVGNGSATYNIKLHSNCSYQLSIKAESNNSSHAATGVLRKYPL
ncbi:hypothetical protein ACFQZE_08225 [Paenibacillus sp. GCM10027627]|uniref:hypothetical protein n=1 Tax=unclassified Paenibacillus TaxID=185978 RepID=UPI003633E278